jgi:hypothetical protein
MAISLEDINVKPSGTQTTTAVPGAPPTAEDVALNAAKAAASRESAASARQARRYTRASVDLQAQISALKDSLRNEFKRGRKQNIRDINLMLGQQLDILRESAGLRGDVLLDWAADTEKATGDIQEQGFRNLVRERADSMTAILEQGAGETDAVRAMLVNARNWHSNASDASRAYYDTMQSVNQGITDLNVDTKTALANAHMTAEGKREEQWQVFYDRRAEAMTQLGNTYGSRVELLEQARESGKQAIDASAELGKKDKKKATAQAKDAMPDEGGVAGARKQMKKWFGAASNELGKSYVQKPLPEWIDNYKGTERIDRRQENTNLASAPIFEGVQRAQGATLRKWTA